MTLIGKQVGPSHHHDNDLWSSSYGHIGDDKDRKIICINMFHLIFAMSNSSWRIFRSCQTLLFSSSSSSWCLLPLRWWWRWWWWLCWCYSRAYHQNDLCADQKYYFWDQKYHFWSTMKEQQAFDKYLINIWLIFDKYVINIW